MAKTKPVLCAWVVCSCNSFDSCNKCGGKGGVYEPIKGTDGGVQAETKRCVDIIMSESRVPGIWQIILRDAILSKEKPRRTVEPEDRVRVTGRPYSDQVGTVESVDGAYCVVRMDTSKHYEDVHEFYPNEFVVVTFCTGCDDWHEGRRCY